MQLLEFMWQTAIHNKSLLIVSHIYTNTERQGTERASKHPISLTQTHRTALGFVLLCEILSKHLSLFFPAAPSLPLSFPGLDVVTVMWGFSELYSALGSVGTVESWKSYSCPSLYASWMRCSILAKMHEPHRPSLQILSTSCEMRSKRCTPQQQQPFAWAQSILTSVFAVLPHCLRPHAFTSLGFSTFSVPISCSPPIYQQDEVAL